MERWTGSNLRTRTEFIASLAILAFVALLPLVMGNEYWLGVVIVSMYFAMLAAAWNLLAGYTGQAPEQKPDQARDDNRCENADQRRDVVIVGQ